MLQACGFHPGDDVAWGAIIGTDDLGLDAGSALVWHDLNASLFSTYSRTSGTKKRTALERYDHEHDFRLRVARVAAQRVGTPEDPPPLVVPIWKRDAGITTMACVTCFPRLVTGYRTHDAVDGVEDGEAWFGQATFTRRYLDLASSE